MATDAKVGLVSPKPSHPICYSGFTKRNHPHFPSVSPSIFPHPLTFLSVIYSSLLAWTIITKVNIKGRVIILVLKVLTMASHLAGSKNGTRQIIAGSSTYSSLHLSTTSWDLGACVGGIRVYNNASRQGLFSHPEALTSDQHQPKHRRTYLQPSL